ncbi:MAG: hypothetical protein M3219_03335 [Thermoproteota archaeon]|nr:hypothetical protein [Thermoproteota archaeon]
MAHNGIDIDQFILLTIYPTVTFFIIGLIARKFGFGDPLKYASQASSCVIFAIVYIVAVPNGGAHGLAAVLILFSGILFLMARRHIMHPRGEEENLVQSGESQTGNQKGAVAKTNSTSSSIPSPTPPPAKETAQDK